MLTTSEGVKIGAVGGDFDEQLWEAETKKQQAKEEDEAEEVCHDCLLYPREALTMMS